MHGLSCHNVVEEIANELAERRLSTVNRRAAYLALAQAILENDVRTSQDTQRDTSAALASRAA